MRISINFYSIIKLYGMNYKHFTRIYTLVNCTLHLYPCRLSRYSEFRVSSKLHDFLGEIEEKMTVAQATGTNNTTGKKLKRLMPQSTTGEIYC